MADKNPYGLRNADIENLDLSEFAKDFSEDELAAVRAGLLQKRQQQQEQFNALPVFDQAKIYAGEKFGEVKKAVEDNPELLLGVLAGKAALDVGSSTVEKTKSLYDRMINKPSDSLGAPQPQPAPAAKTEIPSVEAAAQEAAQQAAAEGKIKTGKAGGSISAQDAAILSNVESGQQVSNVTETVGKAPPTKPKKAVVPSFKTAADIPEGMVFRSDVGNLDRSLVNILGPEGRLYAKDVLNEGKMFGNYKGADYNKKVSELVNAYGEKLKEITPSIDLTTREGRIVAGAPHTQNYGSALGKAAKVGGVLGTLMTVAQSANAKEAAQAVGESLLPIGITPSEVQSGKLTAKQLKAFEEAQKLGSPYRSVPPPR